MLGRADGPGVCGHRRIVLSGHLAAWSSYRTWQSTTTVGNNLATIGRTAGGLTQPPRRIPRPQDRQDGTGNHATSEDPGPRSVAAALLRRRGAARPDGGGHVP